MRLSVIVPVYNVEKYIDKCLNSLVNQTLKDIEIIVVNDGTKDKSEDIIKKYMSKYSNIVYLKKENGGQGSARNYGLEHAKGDYIGYVDSDDYVELDMYEKMYSKAIEDNSDMVICGSYNIKDDIKTLDIDRKLFDSNINAFFGRMAVWNKIYKKDLLTKNNMTFRSKYWYEDLDFTVKVLSKASKISYVDEPLYNYILRDGSTMNNSNIDRNLEIILAFDNILSSVDKKYYDVIEYLAVDHLYISTIVRIINSYSNNKMKLENINKLLEYMNKNFPNYKNNKYIYTLPRNRKIIYNLLNKKRYNMIRLIFKLKGK